ncbi:MAG TPA: PEP-CTERM sorting domain-containing protein [Fimbriimonadaceae bacterium]|nr:PEP-CTERM sorting domain-containing protein [Fimbriimonadaceae bacterium]
MIVQARGRWFAMKQFWRGTCVLAGLLPILGQAALRRELNAFLDTPVNTTPELIREVNSNAEVRDRYMRHYGMTHPELVAFLGTLHPGHMLGSKSVRVFGVPDDGVVHVHSQTLHRGDSIFIDPHGRGAILGKCGNPITLGPNNLRNMSLDVPPPAELDVLTPRAIASLTPPPEVLLDNRPAMAMYVPPDTLADVVSDIPPVTTTVVTAPAPPAPAPAPPPASGGNRNGLALIPLLGGGALLGILGSHHGGGGPIVPPPAPEPATFMLIGVGALALLKRKRS